MTYTTTATAVRGVLLAAALLLAAAAPARAARQETSPGDWLRLTVTHGDAWPGGTRGTLLLCDPPRGHARAAEACDRLDAAGGDIDRIPVRDTLCTMVYAPVTVRAHGRWHGRPVAYERTFGNDCELAARTGPVFALDG
ncbi:SSI family serine proteinase inhibitor [Streptomyces sp. NPDC093094]|uniref:SSI family serine proteinase inhibitor n=1 Tax=Streptomyces sp. NPDC093094 TaxID=3366026 RepID=UPI0037FC833C